MRFVALFFVVFLASRSIAADQVPIPPAQEEIQPGSISGQVMIDDKTPMPYGVVLLYDGRTGPPPALGRYWRVPDLITPLGPEGRFALEVMEGTYYLQVAQKNPGGDIGPAVENEYLYFHGDAEGNALPLVVGKSGGRIDLGRLKAFLWSPDMVRRDKGITSVEGVVVDTAGSPVERAVVLAHYNPGAKGRPVFVSDRTDKKGRYQLRTNDGGTFYLSVRGVVGGGKPADGEYLNTTKEF
ncbi:MAG TPA: carboxypeptidase-like regulatory domain-containing protein, partial [Geobacteraceae bacterium]|nr:carboxypeptidase-like regulatory domain-containing protein [Geobacteraceae bacterium]